MPSRYCKLGILLKISSAKFYCCVPAGNCNTTLWRLDKLKKIFSLILVAISIFLSSCSSQRYEDGYAAGYNAGYRAAISADSYDGTDDPGATSSSPPSAKLPLTISSSDVYELSLIDVYLSDETYSIDWDGPEKTEPCYVIKFMFTNKHESSNIRVALVDASINGYALKGASSNHSDDSFSVYTWSGDGLDNSAVDCFRLFLSDIEKATNVRDAENMNDASLSFTFRMYIIDEMDDYGDDVVFTVENVLQYCS